MVSVLVGGCIGYKQGLDPLVSETFTVAVLFTFLFSIQFLDFYYFAWTRVAKISGLYSSQWFYKLSYSFLHEFAETRRWTLGNSLNILFRFAVLAESVMNERQFDFLSLFSFTAGRRHNIPSPSSNSCPSLQALAAHP